MEPCIEVALTKFGDNFGYDIRIHSKEATIAHYISAIDRFLEEKVAPCLGCDSCCYERLPLTLPDLYHYAGKEEGNIHRFVLDHCDFGAYGPALDIKLKQKENGACIFLDPGAKRCNHYLGRGLVCHTYICLPQSEEAAEIRSALVNQGEDALIGYLLSTGPQNHLPLSLVKRQKDYPILPLWQGKEYEEILLKDILPPSLWEKVFKAAQDKESGSFSHFPGKTP